VTGPQDRDGEVASSQPEPPHDVLAAEEFAVGTGDPRLHREPPHDVLAAEEFAVGTADPRLRHDGALAGVDLSAPAAALASEPHRPPLRGRLVPAAGAAAAALLALWVRRGLRRR